MIIDAPNITYKSERAKTAHTIWLHSTDTRSLEYGVSFTSRICGSLHLGA